MGSATLQHSIRYWSIDHRTHHRYTDTDKDPYGVKQGLFHAHIGWMLRLRSPKCHSHIDSSDLDRDPLIIFQNRYYLPIVLFMGIVVPVSVCGIGWGDWAGGYLYASVLRTFFGHHAVFNLIILKNSHALNIHVNQPS